MKKNIFLLVPFLFCFYACVHNILDTYENGSNAIIRYPDLDSLCSFFPPEGNEAEEWVRARDVDMDDTLTRLESSCCENFMVVKKSKLHCNYDSIVSFAKQNALQILNDSSIYIALKDRKLLLMDTIDEKFRNAELSHIMPDFSVLYDSAIEMPWSDTSTRSGLVSGYNFYVIKSGNSFVLNDRWNVQRKWLPAHLQHGYRSGIAINPDNDYIVFWCIAW